MTGLVSQKRFEKILNKAFSKLLVVGTFSQILQEKTLFFESAKNKYVFICFFFNVFDFSTQSLMTFFNSDVQILNICVILLP